LFLAACSQEKNGIIAYRISEKDLIPEGITYSSITNSFYLSSIYKTKIIQINAETGEFKDFIPSELLELSFLGLIADDKRKILWACGNRNLSGDTISMVCKFNLISGELLRTYSHNDTVSNTYNDLALDAEGNLYFTDSDGQCIYKIDCLNDSISVFFEGNDILHPNGITISPDYKFLYVASNDNGIRVLDIQNRNVINETDTMINSKGIDGLKFYRNSLIGIRNEVKTSDEVKIAQYSLDHSGTKITAIKTIDQNNPYFDIPTTFVIVSNHLYCLANSQLWNISSSELTIKIPAELNDILILKYRLNSQ
jgi:WD40 repeat protein